MSERRNIDLREAINAISDVVQNRPRPLRELDQIYMKTGDMVLQSEIIANWADAKRLAFIGDGDAISVCIAYLQNREILNYGPSQITVYDFDERTCNAVTRFADRERLEHLSSKLYNCFDAFPDPGYFDCFYTNPPWGASNTGTSVNIFAQRGMEATGYCGEGTVVIADSHELQWPQQVLAKVQSFALEEGFFVQRMNSGLHKYHLDDEPDLLSCNLMFKALPSNQVRRSSEALTDQNLVTNFYGRDRDHRIRYVRERMRLDYGTAHHDEYAYEYMQGDGNDGQ